MKKITDGVYQDDAGAMHLVIGEMLDAAGYADTPANRETLTLAARERLRAIWPHVAITVDEELSVTHVARFECPHCGYQCNAFGTTRGEAGAPEPGCVAGCMACGLPMIFDTDPLTGMMRLRTMTPADAEHLSADQVRELARIQQFAPTWTPLQRRRH